MKEELVSFETAKLLKEKGFSLSYPSACYYNNELWISENLIVHGGIKKIDDNYRFKAPTQSLAQKWLRENCGIHVNVDFGIGWGYQLIPVGWSGERFSEKFIDNKGWKTYEEALEEGLKQGLMLIK